MSSEFYVDLPTGIFVSRELAKGKKFGIPGLKEEQRLSLEADEKDSRERAMWWAIGCGSAFFVCLISYLLLWCWLLRRRARSGAEVSFGGEEQQSYEAA